MTDKPMFYGAPHQSISRTVPPDEQMNPIVTPRRTEARKKQLTEVLGRLSKLRLGLSDDSGAETIMVENYRRLLIQIKRFAVGLVKGDVLDQVNSLPTDRKSLDNIHDAFESKAHLDAIAIDIEADLEDLVLARLNDIPTELAKLPVKSDLLKDLDDLLFGDEVFAILFIDLDNFKAVNDQLGHSVGDQCLAKVAITMRQAALGKGLLYRLGGDEFAVCMQNFLENEGAAVAERIRTRIDLENPGDPVKVTASIGVASSESDGMFGPDSLIEAADRAMYEAKRRSKNRVVMFSELQS